MMNCRHLAFCLLVGASSLLAPLPALAQEHPTPSVSDMHWRMIGPFRGGRTRAVCGVPDQPNLFYVGQVNGGVWKSDDFGRTWLPLFDGQPSQSIGAIAVAPSNSDILYVASGEGLHRPDLSIGDGIYKSLDAGKTWQHLGLRDGQQIPALAIDPKDPNRIFAAVLGHPYGPNEERGIYRSTDGGKTWERILYRGPNTGASDIEMDPAHPDVLYASLWESRLGPWEDGNQYDGAHGGLFKSTDGGDSWHPLTQGLPTDLVQIQIAIAPSDSNRLYATLSTPRAGGYASGVGMGVYRSDDAGEHWRKATEDPRPAMKIGGGDLPIPKVDPKNPDVVYSASIVTTRSIDGGKTWTSLRGAPGGDDYQNLWINPDNPRIILLGSDQGAVVTVNGGRTWSSWFNQPTAQLYHVATSNTFPYHVYSAQQESGSVDISSRGNDGSITFRDWHPAGAIEYGYLAPDPLHPEIIYGAGRTEVSKYNTRTGQVQNVTPLPLQDGKHRADRTEPIIFSPTDPHLLYYATNVLFQTRDGGATWKAVSPDLTREHAGQPASLQPLPPKDAAKRLGAIYAVAPSFQNANTLWVGTDDGLIWVSRDQGKAWKDVTPPALTPWSKVTQISASPFDDDTAYASISRFRIDDLHPYLYRTHDGGVTWRSISAGLPDNSPVNTIREDPVRKGLLFAGTENAVWMSLDDGDHWQSLQLNLPHTSMRDLCIHGNDLVLATHGRSLWILDDISSLRQLDATVPGTGMILFKPGDAIRVRRSTNTDTPLPADEPAGENPPNGAILDYYLAKSVSSPATLEILDAQGRLVRRYSSADAPDESEAMQLIPRYWLRTPRVLSTQAGMHRWVWDLRYAAPVSTHYEYPISAIPHATPRVPQGPLVLPGIYTVRLTVEGHIASAPLMVTMDPRVPASNEDLSNAFALESRLASLLSSSSEASLQAHSLREQMAGLSKGAKGALATALKNLDDRLTVLLKGPKTPDPAKPGLDALVGDVGGLYTQVGQADACPTAAQQQAAEQSGDGLRVVLEEWERVKSSVLPKVNRELRATHLRELSLQRKPQNMPQGGDEE